MSTARYHASVDFPDGTSKEVWFSNQQAFCFWLGNQPPVAEAYLSLSAEEPAAQDLEDQLDGLITAASSSTYRPTVSLL